MNPKEENLTNLWLKFLSEDRKYHILIRGLNHYKLGEFDVIGIRFKEMYESDPWIENIETKFTDIEHPERTVRKIIKQIEKRYKLKIFNSILVATNSKQVLNNQSLQRYVGLCYVEPFKANSNSKGQIIRDSIKLPNISYVNRDKLLGGISQFYKTSKTVGVPCTFVKCSRQSCNYYYGFRSKIPIPPFVDERGHSAFCKNADERARKYLFGHTSLRIGDVCHCIENFNIPR